MSLFLFRLPNFQMLTVILLVQLSLFEAIANVVKLAEGGDAETVRAAERFAERLASTWTSTALMPFGKPASAPGEKTFESIPDRVLVFGVGSKAGEK